MNQSKIKAALAGMKDVMIETIFTFAVYNNLQSYTDGSPFIHWSNILPGTHQHVWWKPFTSLRIVGNCSVLC